MRVLLALGIFAVLFVTEALRERSRERLRELVRWYQIEARRSDRAARALFYLGRSAGQTARWLEAFGARYPLRPIARGQGWSQHSWGVGIDVRVSHVTHQHIVPVLPFTRPEVYGVETSPDAYVGRGEELERLDRIIEDHRQRIIELGRQDG